MRVLITISLAILFSVGCSEKGKVPSDVIPKEKMEKVFWDMMLADRFASQFILKDSAKLNVKTESFKLFEQVFKVNNITRADFIKSYKYYMGRPDITKVMFDSLSARSSRNRDSILKSVQSVQ